MCAEDVQDGTLKCDDCRSSFPVEGGIPRFVSGDSYAKSFGYQWNKHKRTQLDSYTSKPITRTRLIAVTDWADDLRGAHILEAGCGAGRFTEILVETGATVFSFDVSSAVDANRETNCSAKNLNLFQADIFHIPLPERSFDKVLCLGVLQHTPDPERAFNSLARYVRPGGELVIDIYSRRPSALFSWKYLLRPITKRLDKQFLYKTVTNTVRVLLPVGALLRKYTGRYGARLLPIVEYSHLGLEPGLNREWAILDTFDMYSPEHDHPQSLATVQRWFQDLGFSDIMVAFGPNGVVGRGRRPTHPPA